MSTHNNGIRGFTIWFTGKPCSGKSTLAARVARELEWLGRSVEVLDGDAVRANLTKGLGFSKEDRDENIRRIGYVCRLLSKHGAVAIAAAISPYRAARDEVRASIDRFVEVYVKASLETCIRRDVKGMYKKALAGEIKNFTGIDDPYEPPLHPELVIETDHQTPAACTAHIIAWLEQAGLIGPASRPDQANVEAAKVPARAVVTYTKS